MYASAYRIDVQVDEIKDTLEAGNGNSIFQDVTKCNLYDPLYLFTPAPVDKDDEPATKKRKSETGESAPSDFHPTNKIKYIARKSYDTFL